MCKHILASEGMLTTRFLFDVRLVSLSLGSEFLVPETRHGRVVTVRCILIGIAVDRLLNQQRWMSARDIKLAIASSGIEFERRAFQQCMITLVGSARDVGCGLRMSGTGSVPVLRSK